MAFTVSLTAATARHQASVPGVGGDTASFTTFTAPISDVRGCIRQQVVDALWELAEQYDVGVWFAIVQRRGRNRPAKEQPTQAILTM
jgi:hypothetical protein